MGGLIRTSEPLCKPSTYVGGFAFHPGFTA